MEELKALFGEESLNYATFEQKLNESGLKLADLSKGNYVDKSKYDKKVAEFDKYKTDNDITKFADYDSIKAENESLKAEKATNEMISKITQSGISSKFAKFVLSEVKPLITKEKDFDACLKEYAEQNPQYKENTKPIYFKGNTGNNVTEGKTGTQNENEKMNNFIRGK